MFVALEGRIIAAGEDLSLTQAVLTFRLVV